MSSRAINCISAALITVGIVVFGLRLYYKKYHIKTETVDMISGKMYLNEKNFNKLVLDRHPEILRSAVNLIVFADIERDCPTCLMEAEEWVAPLYQHPDLFSLTIFLPSDTEEETV
ncbi:MAG: hypothetical protein CR997_03830 [Acidobacteria bacterium]|nr:MAG: hypothetical protein CR997_03830 [Acidobacteriota bacterium]